MNTYTSPPGDGYTFSDYCKFEREETTLTRPVSPTPFIPADTGAREQRCEEDRKSVV